MGTVCFGNDPFAAIIGYGYYVQGNLTICHVYYVEGLGHNLFSIGQFCDGDLEVAFRSNTCYVWNLEGDDLITGSRDSNLYTVSIFELAASSPFHVFGSLCYPTNDRDDLGKMKPKADIDPGVAEGPVTQTVITHNATYQADVLDAYDYDCDEFSTAKVVLMANLSSYGSDVLSEITNDSNIIPYSRYLLETQNTAVQDTNSPAQQDAIILSVFEKLSNQVTNCNKVNKDNLIANESLSAELERYKEREKEAKNIDTEIALEKKVKELDNIVYKMDQSAQTVHMLTKPQVFYDKNLKQALGFQNTFYLKKAQQIMPMLYDGSVIAKETNVISSTDSEETLMLDYAELNRLYEDFGKRFVPHQELSDEQAFWLHTVHPNTNQCVSSLVKIVAPRELPKIKTAIQQYNIVNIVVNSSLNINTSMNVNSSGAMNNSVNYVEMCNKCLKLEAELFKQHNMVEKDEYNRLSKSFSKLEQHCISLELAM
ncbi:hypothetical protein Tco_0565492 [Tanacetum coccineum]